MSHVNGSWVSVCTPPDTTSGGDCDPRVGDGPPGVTPPVFGFQCGVTPVGTGGPVEESFWSARRFEGSRRLWSPDRCRSKSRRGLPRTGPLHGRGWWCLGRRLPAPRVDTDGGGESCRSAYATGERPPRIELGGVLVPCFSGTCASGSRGFRALRVWSRPFRTGPAEDE